MATIDIIFTICVLLYYWFATIASGTYLLHNVEENRAGLTILVLLFGWGVFILLVGQFLGNCFLLREKQINEKKTTQNDSTIRGNQI